MSRGIETFLRLYNTECYPISVVATHVILDAITAAPQLARDPMYVMAYMLLLHHDNPKFLSLQEFDLAEIDQEIAWDKTKKIHKAFSIGTNSPDVRNPDRHENPAVYPVSPGWLVNFIDGFREVALKVIESQVITALAIGSFSQDRDDLYAVRRKKMKQEHELRYNDNPPDYSFE